MDWNDVVQDRGKLRAVLNAVINFVIHRMRGRFD